MSKRQATYQAEWSLLMSGVAQARLEMHRIRHHLHRARQLVDQSEHKDAIFEVAGDILQAVPSRWRRLENLLDRTAYALMILGEGNYRDRLPMDDRALVDDAQHNAQSLMASRVASRFLEARFSPLPSDMSTWLPGGGGEDTEEPQLPVKGDPQLGWPGGPCHLVQRIRHRVRNPSLRNELEDDVETQGHLDKGDERKVYRTVAFRGVGSIQKILLVPHAQHRMDLREVVIHDIRLALKKWLQVWEQGKSLGHQNVRKPKLRAVQQQFLDWSEKVKRGMAVEYEDPTTGIFLVFKVKTSRSMVPDEMSVITAYWRGTRDPHPPGVDGCEI